MKKTVLTAVIVIFSLFYCGVMPSIANTASQAEIKAYIVKTATEQGVEPEIALSIAKAESGFSQSKRSHQGAVGVFQLMPATARRIGYNPYNYKENIKGGIVYYKQMQKMFKTKELALAAYNAGPGCVKRYGGVPPYRETRNYVSKIMKHYHAYKHTPDNTVQQYLITAKEDKKVRFARERHEVLTMFMIKQAI